MLAIKLIAQTAIFHKLAVSAEFTLAAMFRRDDIIAARAERVVHVNHAQGRVRTSLLFAAGVVVATVCGRAARRRVTTFLDYCSGRCGEDVIIVGRCGEKILTITVRARKDDILLLPFRRGGVDGAFECRSRLLPEAIVVGIACCEVLEPIL